MNTRLKSVWNYENNAPICGNCAHLKQPNDYMVNSRIRTSKPFCKKGEFFVKLGSYCDMWRTKE